MENIEERSINGLIDLWTDIYFVLGKEDAAKKLRPDLKVALAGSGSFIHSLVEATRESWVNYECCPVEVRRNLVREALTKKAGQVILYNIVDSINAILKLYFTQGITAAEGARQVEQVLKEILSVITIRELVNLPNLPLRPGSVAGADRRLRTVLNQRLKTFSGNLPYYEQDLKAALWQAAKGKHMDEFSKMARKYGSIEERASLIIRLYRGEENEFVKEGLIRTVRKTIEDLDDIHQDVRNLKAQGRELPLTEEMLVVLPAKREQYENALDNLLDMMTERGVDISRLKARDLELLSDELNRRKYGMTHKEHYGEKENQRKQQLKYLSKKIKRVKATT